MPDPAIDHPGKPDLARAIEDRTESLIVERLLLKKGMLVVADTEQTGTQVATARSQVQVLPPIQIRGLAADVMTVKRGFAEIREVVREVNAVGAGLKQDLHDVKAQLQGHREDIRFEAETLGNSGEG